MRILKYTFTIGLIFLFDVALFALLLMYADMPYYIATAVAFATARTISYVVNRLWAFSGTIAQVSSSYIYFMFFSTLGLLTTVFGVVLLVEFINIAPIISRIIVGVLLWLVGFVLNETVVFKMHKLC